MFGKTSCWSATVLVVLVGCGRPEIGRDTVRALFDRPARWVRDVSASGDAARGERQFVRHCAACHPPDRWFADGQRHERGGRLLDTPSLVDVSLRVRLGWLGGHGNLRGAVLAETAMPAPTIGEGAGAATTEPASVDDLVAWLSTLRCVGRWDRFVDGDEAALSAEARRGLTEFVAVGCATCHAGRQLGGAFAFELGVVVPWPGRERGPFMAPQLRTAAHTAPYLHDGSIAGLPDAIRAMARHQLGRELSDAQVMAIAQFLVEVGETDGNGR